MDVPIAGEEQRRGAEEQGEHEGAAGEEQPENQARGEKPADPHDADPGRWSNNGPTTMRLQGKSGTGIVPEQRC